MRGSGELRKVFSKSTSDLNRTRPELPESGLRILFPFYQSYLFSKSFEIWEKSFYFQKFEKLAVKKSHGIQWTLENMFFSKRTSTKDPKTTVKNCELWPPKTCQKTRCVPCWCVEVWMSVCWFVMLLMYWDIEVKCWRNLGAVSSQDAGTSMLIFVMIRKKKKANRPFLEMYESKKKIRRVEFERIRFACSHKYSGLKKTHPEFEFYTKSRHPPSKWC
jgi:hypothetical protein